MSSNTISVLLGLWWLFERPIGTPPPSPGGSRWRHAPTSSSWCRWRWATCINAPGWRTAARAVALTCATAASAHVAVLFPRPAQLWAAGRCQPPARLQPASSTSRIALIGLMAALPSASRSCQWTGGAIPELRGGSGVSGGRRHRARLGPGSTGESLVRALRCVLRVVRAHGIGGGTVEYATAAQRGRCTSSIFVPAGPSTYAN